MDQNNEENDEPKPHGQPPPYTHSDLPQVMRPTNIRVKTGDTVPTGQPITDAMGQPIPIQHGTMTLPNGGMNNPLVGPAIIPVVVGSQMGPKSAAMTCPSCRIPIVTRIEAKTTTKTHAFAIMFGVLCLWPCVAIPYCLDSCRNVDHYCPNCSAYIGSYVN